MRLIHTIPSISEEASGPTYSVTRLCKSLIDLGEDTTLVALDWSPIGSPPHFLKTFPLGLGPRKLGRSPAMRRWLFKQVRSEQTILLHNHGMWQMNSLYPGWAANDSAAKLVVSPHGAFSPWAMQHGSRMKRLFWRALQRPAIKGAVLFHATAESEYLDIRRLGFQQPVLVLPIGIDLPTPVPRRAKAHRTLLFLGRLHPVKGLDNLLSAWSRIEAQHPLWRLRIVGSDAGYYGKSGYAHHLRHMQASLGASRIDFVEALYGEKKLEAYRCADLFVLPSHSENFGVTVAEALAAGVPAIATRGTPWQGLEQNQCGWYCDVGPIPLAGCLQQAMECSPEALIEMGMRGRDWMEREFSWSLITQRMVEGYEWLLHEGTPAPSCIRID